jgi:predicted O-methyltransferase YrrM
MSESGSSEVTAKATNQAQREAREPVTTFVEQVKEKPKQGTMPGTELDFDADVLKHCGGRLTLPDAKLLYETATAIKARNIVEIGSMDGCSTMILGDVARTNNGLVRCIEPAPKQKWRANVERLGLEDHVALMFASSPWVSHAQLDLPIDYLLIDGDHRTRWAIVDYHYFMPFVRMGGYIAFHDWWDQHDAGKWVREAVEIIMRDDSDMLKIVGEAQNARGLIVFEKVGEHNRYR